MPNRRNRYVDKEKYKKTRRKQSTRYYKRTQLYEKKMWLPQDERLVLEHKIPDSMLSIILQRSVGAIQTKRYTLRLKEKKEEEEG